MAATQQDSDDIISGINVTPLVDIVLVILIIFIVTASLVFRHNIPVELPKAQSAEESLEGTLNLALTREGALYLNGAPAVLDDIPVKVAEARARMEASKGKVSAFVSADVRSQYGSFAEVVDRLRLAGVSDIALDTKPTEAPGE